MENLLHYLFILFIYFLFILCEVGKIKEKATFDQKEGRTANHRTCHLTKPRDSKKRTSTLYKHRKQ
ncbi:hypothetical protein RhiirA5_442500 [Rhizophagus irregularis]|uniref:Uncharacterized protein n=1 Tax=Rhizophagus irregularis TaxID=588596 RepID=A0A2N0NEP8_9GLOM|nr:hypothetical protein RhiirA5_442500 [Rhizophagus irregularis]